MPESNHAQGEIGQHDQYHGKHNEHHVENGEHTFSTWVIIEGCNACSIILVEIRRSLKDNRSYQSKDDSDYPEAPRNDSGGITPGDMEW